MIQADLLAVISSAMPGLNTQSASQTDPFQATLQLGDVIRGKVLQNLGPSRYLVDFKGFERVVDSAIPLRTDEILYGRVLGVGDRVELQRVRSEVTRSEAMDVSAIAQTGMLLSPGVSSLMSKLLARWSFEEVTAVEHLIERAADAQAMKLAASATAKTGLPFSRDLIELVYSILSRRFEGGAFPLRSDAIVVETIHSKRNTDVAIQNPQTLVAFAELLKAEFEASRQALVRSPLLPGRGLSSLGKTVEQGMVDDERREWSEEMLSGALFNVQKEGAVSHAVATIPFVVDGRLIELDMAMFQQENDQDNGGKLPYRRIVIELATECLGRIGIAATLVDDHVQLNLASDNAAAIEYMAPYSPVLRSQVEANGWVVDEIRYRVEDPEKSSFIGRAVMEHVVSQDSFSRLI